MYSIVPQNVWVTVPSWMDSLHSPKSVNFTWPGRKNNNMSSYFPLSQHSKNCGFGFWRNLNACWRQHTVAVEHNVLRFQVSVDDALLVQVAKSHGDLCQVETTTTTTLPWRHTVNKKCISNIQNPQDDRKSGDCESTLTRQCLPWRCLLSPVA